jgi:hypothetical protein
MKRDYSLNDFINKCKLIFNKIKNNFPVIDWETINIQNCVATSFMNHNKMTKEEIELEKLDKLEQRNKQMTHNYSDIEIERVAKEYYDLEIDFLLSQDDTLDLSKINKQKIDLNNEHVKKVMKIKNINLKVD